MNKYDIKENIQELHNEARKLNYAAEYTKQGDVENLALLWSIVYGILDKLPEDHANEILAIADKEYQNAEETALHGWYNR